MNNYRIYAKILGPILPKDKTSYEDCFIEQMYITEQERRNFKPIEADNSPEPIDNENFYKSYITHHRIVDPRIIKTEYVIYTDIETYDVSSALGNAINRFEKITGTLAMTASIAYAKKYNVKARYTSYEYQICRIYQLIDGEESNTEVPIFVGSGTSLIKLPSSNDMNELDENLIERMLKSKDDIFLKSLSYLQSGAKGFHNNTPPEKMTLDFMKSIEIILNLCKGKTFSPRLRNLAKEFGVDKEDCDQIKKLWALRGGGDVAHAKRGSRTNFLPPQYPVPSNVEGPYIDSSSLAVRVLTKYFLFRDSIISIKISDKQYDDIDELVDVNHGTVYTIRPSNKDRSFLTHFLKNKISKYFNVPIKNIKLYDYQLPYIYFRITDHLKFNLNENKIPRKKLVIFGSI